MDFILDNPQTEKVFKNIVRAIPSMQNGIVSESMAKRGIQYEKNWGASIVDLRNFAGYFEKDHLLALKLWNKKWRETMIMATMLDQPEKVSEEQMDFWIKTAGNTELVEQAVINLFVNSPFAFAKAFEWCRGKKFLVKYAGLMMLGRLALSSKSAIDEMFEPIFELLLPLSRDESMHTALYRTICQVSRRSDNLLFKCQQLAATLQESDFVATVTFGKELVNELNCEKQHDS